MRPPFLFLVALLLLPLLASPATAESLLHNGRERDYILRLPAGVANPPLIVVLHGGGGRGRQIERHSDMTDAALAAGFAVAYPDGIDRHWNDGRGDPISKAHQENVDDVGFLAALVAQLGRDGKIDPGRVFVMGISNGGMMTYRMLCEQGDLFRGGVAIVANLGQDLAQNCSPTGPVALMVLNGTADPLVPYEGGPVMALGEERGWVLSTEATLERFALANGCEGRVNEPVNDPAPSDGVTPEHDLFLGCQAPLELWRFVGGGHGWPGASQYLGKRLIGIVPDAPDANELALRFFLGRLQGY